MYAKNIAHFREDLRNRYTYDPEHHLAFRWRTISPNNRKATVGDIAGCWSNISVRGKIVPRRFVYVAKNRAISLARAVWVHVNGTEPPDFLRPNPDNPFDFRIENLVEAPPPRKTIEERKAKGIAALETLRASLGPEKYKEFCRRNALRRFFGITPDDYSIMLKRQGGACAICKMPETVKWSGGSSNAKWLAVDHCHQTMVVRGLLCASCNNGLGRFNDDPERLRAAADYIERAQSPDADTIKPHIFHSKGRRAKTGCRFNKNSRKKPWVATIRVNGETVYLGGYPTEDEAHQAYTTARTIRDSKHENGCKGTADDIRAALKREKSVY